MEKLGYVAFFRPGGPELGGKPNNMAQWVDSTSALSAMKPIEPTKGTRHYVLRYLLVRQHAAESELAARFCTIGLMRADALAMWADVQALMLLLGQDADRKGGGK